MVQNVSVGRKEKPHKCRDLGTKDVGDDTMLSFFLTIILSSVLVSPATPFFRSVLLTYFFKIFIFKQSLYPTRALNSQP